MGATYLFERAIFGTEEIGDKKSALSTSLSESSLVLLSIQFLERNRRVFKFKNKMVL